MNIDIGIKLHNKFEIEVKNVETGEIEQRAKGYNIVLDAMYEYLCAGNNNPIGYHIHYGEGTGTPGATDTELFSKLGAIVSSIEETELNLPPTASFCKKKIVIPIETHTGKTITEVGLSKGSNTSLIVTHSMLEDSEGNPISIGPLTALQEVTIYSTVFAEVTLPSGMLLTISASGNELLHKLLGVTYTYFQTGSTGSTSGIELCFSSNKTATDQATNYSAGDLGGVACAFDQYDVSNKKQSTSRIRRDTGDSNGKIWSVSLTRNGGTISTRMGIARILFPATGTWTGFDFVDEPIGTGDGVETEFDLPWSDINESEEYTIYVDGVAQTENTDYTLSNTESTTSITFTTAPADTKAITGDWHVDYVPKDSDHIFDVTLSITYGEGS